MAKTKARYLDEHKDLFMQTTFKNVVSANLSKLIDAKSLHEWKEILAYCITYSSDGGKQLAGELGNELLQKRNDLEGALICFLVANSFNSAIALWERKLKNAIHQANRRDRPIIFQRLFEKIIMFKTITRCYDSCDIFDDFILYQRRYNIFA